MSAMAPVQLRPSSNDRLTSMALVAPLVDNDIAWTTPFGEYVTQGSVARL
jgi:hypothetical protein